MRVVDLSSLLTAVSTRERTEALIVAVVVVVVDFAPAPDADDAGVRDFSLMGYGLNLADLSLSAMMEGRMPELASRLV